MSSDVVRTVVVLVVPDLSLDVVAMDVPRLVVPVGVMVSLR